MPTCLCVSVLCPSPSFSTHHHHPARPGGFVMCCQSLFVSVTKPHCCSTSAQKGWWVYNYLSLPLTARRATSSSFKRCSVLHIVHNVYRWTEISAVCLDFQSFSVTRPWCSPSLFHRCWWETKPIKAAPENMFVLGVVWKTAARNPLRIQ